MAARLYRLSQPKLHQLLGFSHCLIMTRSHQGPHSLHCSLFLPPCAPPPSPEKPAGHSWNGGGRQADLVMGDWGVGSVPNHAALRFFFLSFHICFWFFPARARARLPRQGKEVVGSIPRVFLCGVLHGLPVSAGFSPRSSCSLHPFSFALLYFFILFYFFGCALKKTSSSASQM